MTDATEQVAQTPLPRINKVDIERPWQWLQAGWRDLRATPTIGPVYGALYAVLGLGLVTFLWLNQVLYVSLPLGSMFILLGPILAVGLYSVSQDRMDGRQPSLARSLTAWRANPSQIALMGVALLLFAFAWMRLAFLIFFAFFGLSPVAPEALIMVDEILSPERIPFLAVGTAVGAVLAACAFAISVVSIPLLVDHREANVITAIITSVRAVQENFWTMALWAWLIALFIGAGLITAYVGLIVTLPLIGHASWHAYKDIVSWDETAA